MNESQLSLTEVEYQMRHRVPKRERFLMVMDGVIPWSDWVEVIQPFYYDGVKGRKPVKLETMLRMYLLQCWYSLSDEGVEDEILDSFAMRRFMGVDFMVERVPDATTLCHFRRLMTDHGLGEALFQSLSRWLETQGLVMRGGTVVDATLIDAPSSVKNTGKARDPEMAHTRKGHQYYFGMKTHVGVDAGNGFIHSVEVTAANQADVTQTAHLIRDDDQVVYADAGYIGVEKRPEITSDEHLSRVEFRVGLRKGKLAALPLFDQWLESRKASIRSKVEHVFLIIKRDFGFRKTRLRGMVKNRNHMMMLCLSTNLIMYIRGIQLRR